MSSNRCFLFVMICALGSIAWLHDATAAARTALAPALAHSPSEVLLVYNASSPVSTAVAQYYAQKRGTTNILAVTCQDSASSQSNETIEFADYTSQIQTPIANYLAANSGINFIVLVKGIPLVIDSAPTGSEPQGLTPLDLQPSVDSYLAALGYSTANGNVQASIVGSGAQGVAWINKYYNSTKPFSHAQFGGYLVTRLDGFTQGDAMALVDRSLAAAGNPQAGTVLFDVDSNFGLGDWTTMPPATVSKKVTAEESFDHGNADLLHAAKILQASGIPTDLAITTTFVGNQGNLLGYYGWGSNDSDYNNVAYESLTFAPGAIANTYVSSSMRTFFAQYVGFNSIQLTGMTALQARVANANTDGNSYIFQVRIDNPSGQAIGTCTVPETGGSQTWATTTCNLAPGLSGVHNVYLVFIPNGFGGSLYNLEWIAFTGVPSVVEAASYNAVSGSPQLEQSAEGGQDLGYITNGSYALYSSVNLANATSLTARVAADSGGGNIEIHLDSPNGASIGTCTVPGTGDWQTYVTTTCPLAGASGIHDVYLVFTGPGGYLFNVLWFQFAGSPGVIEVASNSAISGGSFLEASSEGAMDLTNIFDGQSQMGDLIANGLTGAEGYVNEPTLNGIVGVAYNIQHYEAGYTLAESFAAGTPYLGWEGVIVGDPLAAPYFGAPTPVTPTPASSFNGSAGGVQTESSSEGDLDVGFIASGSYTFYNGIELSGMTTFRARVASAGPGGDIQIRIGGPTGQEIGDCVVPTTGDWQSWITVTCPLTATSGTQSVYLVFNGDPSSGGLFNVQWFAFLPSK
jgi:uncharacterized protein (TIGR03790 family)